MEIIPGNYSVVHHVLIFSDTSSVPAQRDAQDPAPGYVGFGGTGSNSSQLIGVWAPGGTSYKLPVGMGITLPANTNIILRSRTFWQPKQVLLISTKILLIIC